VSANNNTADRIARVALSILEKEGPEAVSMRRVASAVGITPMAIYHHFPDREALLNTVTDREFAKLLSHIQSHPLNGSVENRVTAVMEGYVDYAFKQPRVFDYVFSRVRSDARKYPQDFRARRSPTLNPIADMLGGEMEKGFLKKDEVWEVALGLWAHVHGYVMLYRAGRIDLSEKEFRKLLHRSLRRFLHGLKNE
jgi:AcrR family transcriptional regulator